MINRVIKRDEPKERVFKSLVQDFYRDNPNVDIATVCIYEGKPKRSDAQSRLYFAWRDILANETGESKDKTHEDLKKKFIHDVMQFDYPKDMLEDFINYCTEGKKRMRWQKQITFEIKLRLLRWNKNQKKWYNPKNSMSKLDAQINEWQEAKKLL